MNQRKEKTATGSMLPTFVNEDEEARWWSSAAGRTFLKRQSAAGVSATRSRRPARLPIARGLRDDDEIRIGRSKRDRTRVPSAKNLVAHAASDAPTPPTYFCTFF
jgi:hypothetical protein